MTGSSAGLLQQSPWPSRGNSRLSPLLPSDLQEDHKKLMTKHKEAGKFPALKRSHQTYQLLPSSGCDTWTHSGPSRSRPPQPAGPKSHTSLSLCHQWLYRQRGPRSAASREGGDRPHPRPPSLEGVPPATGSSQRGPTCSNSPYSAGNGVRQRESVSARCSIKR